MRAVTQHRHSCRRPSRIPRWQAFRLELKAALGGDSRTSRSELAGQASNESASLDAGVLTALGCSPLELDAHAWLT